MVSIWFIRYIHIPRRCASCWCQPLSLIVCSICNPSIFSLSLSFPTFFFLFEPIGQILLNLQKRTNTKQNSCEEERCRRKREDKTNQKFYPFVNFFIIFFHKFVLLVPFLFMPFKKYITYDFSKQIHLMNKFYNLFTAHITRQYLFLN